MYAADSGINPGDDDTLFFFCRTDSGCVPSPSHHAGARESLRRTVKPTDSPLGSHLDNIERKKKELLKLDDIFVLNELSLVI